MKKKTRPYFFAFILTGAFLIVALLIYLTISLVGWYGNMPCNQVGSEWVSDDGRIRFTILETTIPEHDETINGNNVTIKEAKWVHGVGTVKYRGEEFLLDYSDGRGGTIFVKASSSTERPTEIQETWHALCLSNKRFFAKVGNSSLFEGEKIVGFSRID